MRRPGRSPEVMGPIPESMKTAGIIGLFAIAVLLFFSGFAKVRFMITLAKSKLKEGATDKKAVNFMYISGLGLLVAGIVVSLFAFGIV